jgi:opacity protein-like surface antigen
MQNQIMEAPLELKSKLFILLIICLANGMQAQNSRISTHEKIGWYNFFGTVKLSEKFGVHAEYQWRRENYLENWQQGLLRVGVNYQVKPNILARVGYAWIETFPYGELAINGFGKDFSEHRIFEMIQLSHKESTVEFSHRFMLEQRFLGRYLSRESVTEDEFLFLNRMRYMFRMQMPLRGKSIDDKTPYLAFYNEIFVGFGKNVTNNVFDQNRVAGLLGYKFNKNLRVEAGYLNQIVQFGRLVDSKSVFQYNNGFIINTYLNLDTSKKK